MTQEEKELLIKDLSARLPYKVKASYYGTDEEMECTDIIEGIIIDNNDAEIIIGQYGLSVEKVKPYLFPLSSMTEEQRKEYEKMLTVTRIMLSDWTIEKTFNNEYIIPYWFVDFCNKHHLDYYDLIPKGLALDATGLNIY